MAAALGARVTNIPPQNPFDTIETSFGCEIEICIRLSDPTKGCIINPRSETPLTELSTFDKFNLFFMSMLRNVPEDLAEQIPEVGLIARGRRFIFDLQNPIDEKGNSAFYEAMDDEDLSKFGDYTIPIFYSDPTVVCGDSNPEDQENTWNENRGQPVKPNESISFEFVTPVLRFMGRADPARIASLLRPYLLLLGLDKPHCFMVNASTGFHVNVSMKDTRTNEQIPLTEPVFLEHFMPLYLDYERSQYSRVRSRRPVSKKNAANYNATWAPPLYKVFNIEAARGAPPPYTHLRLKMTAVKQKPGEILEFRLFQSEKEIPLLEEYTWTAISLLHRGYVRFSEAEAAAAAAKPQAKTKQEGGSAGLVFAPRKNEALRIPTKRSRKQNGKRRRTRTKRTKRYGTSTKH